MCPSSTAVPPLRRPDHLPAQSSDAANAEVTAAVEELLNSLSNKFAGISSEIFAKSESRVGRAGRRAAKEDAG